MSRRAPKSRNVPPTRGFTAARQGAYRSARLASARSAPPARRRAPQLFAPEIKFYDTALVGSTVAAATDASGGEYDPSATSMISTPAVGDGEQNRDGKRIVVKNVQLKGSIIRTAAEDAANPPAHEEVYVALVLDTQSNAAQMNSEDCFKNLGANAATATCPLRNLLFGSRFRILKSETFCMDAPSASVEGDNLHSSPGVVKNFDWFIPFKEGLIVNFNAGTTASIANVIDNSLHVIAYSINAQSLLSYNARIRFQG